LVLITFLLSANASANDEVFNWAPDIISGKALPSIDAKDQESKQWTNKTMSGKNGFLLLFNRSVVW